MKTQNLKAIIAAIVAVIGFAVNAKSQTTSLIWQKHYTGNSDYENAKDIHYGGDSRIYVCGMKTNSNPLIISYKTDGTQNWATTYSTNGGAFHAVTSYGSGSSIAIYAVGMVNSNGGDMLLVKYNQSGTQQWAATWNNTGGTQEIANSVSVDASGNVYVSGRTSNNGGDIFVRKYNSSGSVSWGITYNSSGSQDDSPQYMTYNSSYVYVTSIRTISASNHDAVLQKIDASNGNISWTSAWDGGIANDIDETYWLDLDGQGSIYTVGTNQTSSNYDALILKYNSSGTLQCANTWNSSNNYDDVLASVDVVFPADNPVVYVTGYTQGNPTSNDADYLTMKFDGTACTSPVWTK